MKRHVSVAQESLCLFYVAVEKKAQTKLKVVRDCFNTTGIKFQLKQNTKGAEKTWTNNSGFTECTPYQIIVLIEYDFQTLCKRYSNTIDACSCNISCI